MENEYLRELLAFSSKEEISDFNDDYFHVFGIDPDDLKKYIAKAEKNVSANEFVDHLIRYLCDNAYDCAKTKNVPFQHIRDFVQVLSTNGAVAALLAFSYISAAEAKNNCKLSEVLIAGSYRDNLDNADGRVKDYINRLRYFQRENTDLREKGVSIGASPYLYLPEFSGVSTKRKRAEIKTEDWMIPLQKLMAANLVSGTRVTKPFDKGIEEKETYSELLDIKALGDTLDSCKWEETYSIDDGLLSLRKKYHDEVSTYNTYSSSDRSYLSKLIPQFRRFMFALHVVQATDFSGELCEQAMLCFTRELIYHSNTLRVLFGELARSETLGSTEDKQQAIEHSLICALERSAIPLAFFPEKLEFRDVNHLAFRYTYHMYLRLLIRMIFFACNEDIGKCCETMRNYINGQRSLEEYINKQKADHDFQFPYMFSSQGTHIPFFANEIIGIVINNVFSRHDYFAHKEDTVIAEREVFEFDPDRITTGTETLDEKLKIKVSVIGNEPDERQSSSYDIHWV